MATRSNSRAFRLAALLAVVIVAGASAGLVAEIQVTPSTATVQVGEEVAFEAAAKNGDGRPVPFTPKWSATGGKISRRGVYVAEKEGEWTVKAVETWTRTEGAARVLVVSKRAAEEPPARGSQAGSVAEMAIEPEKAVVRPQATTAFRVKATDGEGNSVGVELEWKALFGEVSEDGVYKARRDEGADIVTATHSESGLSASAKVTVSTAEREDMGKVELLRWAIDKKTDFLAKPDIAIRFVGSDKARSARLFYYSSDGTRNQLQFTACRSGQAARFQFQFNPSRAEWLEVVVYDFRNRALASVVRRFEED